MTDKIRAALLKLDPSNTEHWTTQGLPRLDAVKSFLGDDVTRADINASSKSFSRNNLSISQPDANPTDAALEPQEIAPVSKEISSDDAIEKECNEARIALGEAQRRMQKASAEMDVVIRKRASERDKRAAAHDIKDYQKSQLEQRMNNMQRAQLVAEAVRAI